MPDSIVEVYITNSVPIYKEQLECLMSRKRVERKGQQKQKDSMDRTNNNEIDDTFVDLSNPPQIQDR